MRRSRRSGLMAMVLAVMSLAPVVMAADPKTEVTDEAQVVFDRPTFAGVPRGAADEFGGGSDPTLEPIAPLKCAVCDPSLALIPERLTLCKASEVSGHSSTSRSPGTKASASTISKESADAIKRAEKAEKKDGGPGAIWQLEKSLTNEPESYALRERLAQYRCRLGDEFAKKKLMDDAAREYRRALFVAPANDRARAALDKVIESSGKNPCDVQVRRTLAEDLEVIPDLESAIVEYRRCLSLKNDSADRVALGWCLRKHGVHRQAFTELKQAAVASWSPDQRATQGTCYRYLADLLWDFAQRAGKSGSAEVSCKRVENAYQCYRNALTLYPKDQAAQAGLLSICDAIAKQNPSVEAWIAKGVAAMLSGEYDTARNAILEAKKLQADNALVSQAMVALTRKVALREDSSQKEVAQGILEIQSCLDTFPRDASAWYVLGRLREKQGDFAWALDAFKQAEDLDPNVDSDLPAALRRSRAHK